jgi:hypothetical protein
MTSGSTVPPTSPPGQYSSSHSRETGLSRTGKLILIGVVAGVFGLIFLTVILVTAIRHSDTLCGPTIDHADPNTALLVNPEQDQGDDLLDDGGDNLSGEMANGGSPASGQTVAGGSAPDGHRSMRFASSPLRIGEASLSPAGSQRQYAPSEVILSPGMDPMGVGGGILSPSSTASSLSTTRSTMAPRGGWSAAAVRDSVL